MRTKDTVLCTEAHEGEAGVTLSLQNGRNQNSATGYTGQGPVHYCCSEVGAEVRVLPTWEEHFLITLYERHGIQSSAHILLRKGDCFIIVGDVKDRPLTRVYTGGGTLACSCERVVEVQVHPRALQGRDRLNIVEEGCTSSVPTGLKDGCISFS